MPAPKPPGPPLEAVPVRWRGRTVVVAATGPSLTPDVAEACRDHPTVAVSDAWRLMPWADVLYSCDAAWWRLHAGVPDFAGERWSTHDEGSNDKRGLDPAWGVHLVAGKAGDIFSADRGLIYYGGNSGFQAVSFAILAGAARVVLVGFDMRVVGGQRHFFGDHPKPLSNRIDLSIFAASFRRARSSLPAGVEIWNATPDSALDCFPRVGLAAALAQREPACA